MHGTLAAVRPRGKMAVTPVLTGPVPRTSLPSPLISVEYPTSTPATSVIALDGPGTPGTGNPSPRARFLPAGVLRQASGIIRLKPRPVSYAGWNSMSCIETAVSRLDSCTGRLAAPSALLRENPTG